MSSWGGRESRTLPTSPLGQARWRRRAGSAAIADSGPRELGVCTEGVSTGKDLLEPRSHQAYNPTACSNFRQSTAYLVEGRHARHKQHGRELQGNGKTGRRCAGPGFVGFGLQINPTLAKEGSMGFEKQRVAADNGRADRALLAPS